MKGKGSKRRKYMNLTRLGYFNGLDDLVACRHNRDFTKQLDRGILWGGGGETIQMLFLTHLPEAEFCV